MNLDSTSKNGPTIKNQNTSRCMATRVIIASETSNKSCKINNLTSRRETILLLLGVSGLSIFEFMTLWTDSALLYQPLEPSPAFLNEGSNDEHSVRASV